MKETRKLEIRGKWRYHSFLKRSNAVNELYHDILALESSGSYGVLITVVDKEGHGPAAIGTKMLVLADGTRKGTVGGGALEYAAAKWAERAAKEKQSGLKKYLLSPDNEIIEGTQGEKTGMMCGGSITLYFEFIGSGANLFIFGAGHIGRALTYHLEKMDFFITLIDSREGMAEEVADAYRCKPVKSSYDSALEGVDVPPGSYFIIVTHSHALDYVVLKRIYQAGWEPAYVGLIASKKKAPAIIGKLKEELGEDHQDTMLDNLYSPVGLRIGGTMPDEIAISIIAEMQAVRYGKEGNRHMRLKS